MIDHRPTRIAILGGGCASIAAAFELSRPEHKHKYEITVYQLGWRLGGKGASGRGPAKRIEEHGFHVWMGYYENAFRLIRECYTELNRDPRRCRISSWRDAFFPAPFIGLAQPTKGGTHRNFVWYFPPCDGLPGDPVTEENNPFSVAAYLVRTAGLMRTILLTKATSHHPAGDRTRDLGLFDRAQDATTEDAFNRIGRLLRLGSLATTTGLVAALGLLEILFRTSGASTNELPVKLLETMAASARGQLEEIVGDDPELLVAWEAIDLGLTGMLGIVRFGLLSDPRGFDAINDYDFREWLRINGASERSVWSPLIGGLYDLLFGYEGGDYQRPRLGAGVALRGSLRLLFSSRGGIFWKMRAGMGDVVFAPFYQVLKRRGVSFQFFHRLERVKLCKRSDLAPGERSYVQALEFDVQAKVRADEYQPLMDLDGLPCWPSTPDYSQLVDGERLKREQRDFESHWDRRKVGTKILQVARDFDSVILGVGFGAVPHVCRDFIGRDRRWQDLATHIKTVETQVFQIWLRDDMQALGWSSPPVSLSSFVHPFETWADMGHLVEEERWETTKPRAIAYFCSTLADSGTPPDVSDPDYGARRQRKVRRNAIHFLNNQVCQLWPKASRGKGRFRWQTLVDPREGRSDRSASAKGEARFDSQYWRANVNPTDRYVLSLPGTQKYRISPLDSTYDNFTVAGDWTACGLDTGCVEAAVISGRLAAHALTSLPKLEDIVGYDHP